MIDNAYAQCNYFLFDKGELMQSKHYFASAIPDNLLAQIRFGLPPASSTLQLFMHCQSKHPVVPGFVIGSYMELDKFWFLHFAVLFSVLGIFVVLALYNLMLFAVLRDSTYLYYMLYMMGLFITAVHVDGDMRLFESALYAYDDTVLLSMSTLVMLSSVMFSIKFLRLPKSSGLYKILIATMVLSIAINIASYFFTVLKPFFMFIAMIEIAVIFAAALKRYKEGSETALFFVVSSGVGMMFIALHFLTLLGFLAFTKLSAHFLFIGVAWDMTTLSFALIYRLRSIEKEKQRAEQRLMIRSRYECVENLSGNIAHQWRTPLASLSAIISRLKAKLILAEVSKEELMASIDKSSELLQHLSQTVGTFEGFLEHKRNDVPFNPTETIRRCIDFTLQTLNANGITVNNLLGCWDVELYGAENEFAQIFLNLINNSKDAFIERRLKNRAIAISGGVGDGCFEVCFCDNAGGIRQDILKNVFEPYITEKEQGSGIGLYLVHFIVTESFSGTVKVENKQKGVCFTMNFPVYKR